MSSHSRSTAGGRNWKKKALIGALLAGSVAAASAKPASSYSLWGTPSINQYVDKASSWLSSALPSVNAPPIEEVAAQASSWAGKLTSALPTLPSFKPPAINDYAAKASSWYDQLSSALPPVTVPSVDDYTAKASSLLNRLSSSVGAWTAGDKTSGITLEGLHRPRWYGLEADPDDPWKAHATVTERERKKFLYQTRIADQAYDLSRPEKMNMQLCEILPTSENHSKHDTVYMPEWADLNPSTAIGSRALVSSLRDRAYKATLWNPSHSQVSQQPPPLVRCTNTKRMPQQDSVYWNSQFLDPKGEKSVEKYPSFFGPFTVDLHGRPTPSRSI